VGELEVLVLAEQGVVVVVSVGVHRRSPSSSSRGIECGAG
jgi:hypothetical protein